MAVTPPAPPPRLARVTAMITAVSVVHAIKPDSGRVGRTAIDKRPVDGPVRVTERGLAGDVQCDERDHGGPERALYAYDEAEAARWAEELGHPVAPGWFGENLTMRGIATTDAVIGEQWQLGAEIEVEVTAPRIPCATFGRHVGQQHWVRRFAARGDVGAYLRVRTTGTVRAGDPVHRTRLPEHGVTVREVFAAIMFGAADPDRLRLLLAEGDDVPRTLRPLLERAITARGAAPRPPSSVASPALRRASGGRG